MRHLIIFLFILVYHVTGFALVRLNFDGGLNNNKYVSENPDNNYSGKSDYFYGAEIEIDALPMISFAAGYRQNIYNGDYTLSVGGYDYKINDKITYNEIPLTVRLSIIPGPLRIFTELSYVQGFKSAYSQSVTPLNSAPNATITSTELKDENALVNVGLGLGFSWFLDFAVIYRYNYGVTNILKDSSSTLKTRGSLIALNLNLIKF